LLPLIFGLIIFAIVLVIVFKILKEIVVGLILIGLVIIASILVLGYFDASSIPFIGQYIPKFSNSSIIVIVKGILYKMEIIGIAHDADNNLLISVTNTGRLDLSGFNATIDGSAVNIKNKIATLKSGQTTVLQTDWSKEFSTIVVKTQQASVTYSVVK
jgi:hypothetical protein